MNLKSLAPLLLSLFTASAFAHSYHDDEAPQPPLKPEVKKEAKAPAPKPRHSHSHSHDADAKHDKSATETPANPAAAEPKKAP